MANQQSSSFADMSNVNNIDVESMIQDIQVALDQFGEYQYMDKGPSEVMDVDRWVQQVRDMPVEVASDVLLQLAGTGYLGEMLASEILLNLQDWDELFENKDVADLM